MASSSTAEELYPHFRLPLWDIVAHKPVCPSIAASAPASSLPQVLSEGGASFAAVVDESGMYVGGVSVFDLLARARMGRHLVQDALVDEEEHNAQLAAQFESMTVEDIMASYSVSGVNPEFRVSGSSTTRSTFHRLAAGLHYQVVVPDAYMPDDNAGRYDFLPTPIAECKLLEKKDILAWALDHLSIVAKGYRSLDAGLVRNGLFYGNAPSIPATTRAGDAIEALYNEKADGIAIVSPDGYVMGNLSVSDAKVVTSNNFADLKLPILEFLELHGRLRDPVTCTKDTTFEQVLPLFVQNSVSRIWVVDESTKLLGVCSMARVMALFFRL